MNALLQATLFMYLCCVGVFGQYNSYGCNSWCNNGPIFSPTCCDQQQLQIIQPVNPDNACIYRPCEGSKYRKGKPYEECNNLDENKKCPESEICCPDDCTQMFVCQPANGSIKACPASECNATKNPTPERLCASANCPRGDMCCPDDCSKTYVCRKPVYKPSN